MPAAGSFQLELQRNPKPGSILLGSGDGTAAGVFGQLVELPHSSLGPHQPEAMVAGNRRSLIVCTPMGMVLELVRSMSLINVATDQMQLPEENSAAPVHG